MRLMQPNLLFTLCALPQFLDAVKFEEYIFAPASREAKPRSVFNMDGTVTGAEGLLETGSAVHPGAIFSGSDSSVTFDFERNVAGRIQFTVGNVPGSGETVGLTYTESSLYVSSTLSDGTGNVVDDFPFNFTITKPGNYTIPQECLRGAFKYLTVTLQTAGSVEITNLQLNYTAIPHFEDLRPYTGYFHSDDELLNRAYTNQLCTITPSEGNALTQVGIVAPGEHASPMGITYLNTTVTNGTSAVVDGAKRDRLVWPGDYSVAFPAIAVSTYDIISITNGLDSLFDRQEPSGQLPYAGFPFGSSNNFSWTYHLYSLSGVANVFAWSNDIDYLQGKWEAWKLALAWSLGTIDETGLMNVTISRDWLRSGLGLHAIEPNAILYSTLELGLSLANDMKDTSVVKDYNNNRTLIKVSANALLWDGAGMYRDNEASTLHPQGGNVWAIRSGLVQNNSQALSISSVLQTRWAAFGATAPEAQNATSPFISSFELDTHMTVNDTDAALELVRRQWGFMMDDPRMTNSTFIEGYSSDGTLHYPPYPNNARISYLCPWLGNRPYLHLYYLCCWYTDYRPGKTWTIWPQPGNLTSVEAGLSTTLGDFSVAWNITDMSLPLEFTTPTGSSGTVAIPTFRDQGKTNVQYTIDHLNGDKMVKVSSKWEDELFVGQDDLRMIWMAVNID